MKKIFIGAVLTIGAVFSAQAADGDSPFKILAGSGLTYGGNTLANTTLIDGSHDSFRAGGLVQLYAGWEYQLGDAITVESTIGYQINEAKVPGGKLRFTTIPVDFAALYSFSPNLRVGGGLQFSARPEFKGSGTASSIDQKYDSAIGPMMKAEYLFNPNMGLELRLVAEKFKPGEGGTSVDGSQVGMMFNFYF